MCIWGALQKQAYGCSDADIEELQTRSSATAEIAWSPTNHILPKSIDSMDYIFVADSMGSSATLTELTPKAAVLCKITCSAGHWDVQGSDVRPWPWPWPWGLWPWPWPWPWGCGLGLGLEALALKPWPHGVVVKLLRFVASSVHLPLQLQWNASSQLADLLCGHIGHACPIHCWKLLCFWNATAICKSFQQWLGHVCYAWLRTFRSGSCVGSVMDYL